MVGSRGGSKERVFNFLNSERSCDNFMGDVLFFDKEEVNAAPRGPVKCRHLRGGDGQDPIKQGSIPEVWESVG